mmetsp:Transcript_11977/g.31342  ORF Transcript_11977/g.31342 Transcript_11977/m.31342 type:complete len:467 (-) Transcript_11977:160-1560(-)
MSSCSGLSQRRLPCRVKRTPICVAIAIAILIVTAIWQRFELIHDLGLGFRHTQGEAKLLGQLAAHVKKKSYLPPLLFAPGAGQRVRLAGSHEDGNLCGAHLLRCLEALALGSVAIGGRCILLPALPRLRNTRRRRRHLDGRRQLECARCLKLRSPLRRRELVRSGLWRALRVQRRAPIDARKERVRTQRSVAFGGGHPASQPLARLDAEQLVYQISRDHGHAHGVAVLQLQHALECEVLGATFERQRARDEVVDGATEGPEVGAEVGRLVINRLRRHVLWRAHELLEVPSKLEVPGGLPGVLTEHLGSPKVYQLNVAVRREQHVLRLDVAVHNLLRVQIIEHVYELGRVECSERKPQPCLVRVVPQLSARHKLCHDVQARAVLEGVVQPDHERVRARGEDVLLHQRLCLFLVPLELLLVDHLHSHVLTSRLELAQEDTRVVALVNDAAQIKVGELQLGGGSTSLRT